MAVGMSVPIPEAKQQRINNKNIPTRPHTAKE